MDKITELTRKMAELLSECGATRADIDAAVDLALEYGETQYAQGWQDFATAYHIPTD